MAHYDLAFIGFGHVGQALARLLLHKRDELEQSYGITFSVNGIATGRHGLALDPHGLELERALALASGGKKLDELSRWPAPTSTLDFLRVCPAQVLFENSPVNHHTGQPAIDHLRLALELGMHAITANKGPVAHAYRELSDLASTKGRRFLFESAVMDGAPIFSLCREALPGARLLGFHGILNSCTNLILTRMEAGESFEEAVAYAQSIGITETDPNADVDGWDAAIKVAILSTVLMEAPLVPQQVERHSIREITPAQMARARQAGQRWKVVCSAQRGEDGSVLGRVTPELVSASSPLYSINGTSSYVQFKLDVLPGLGIVENDPGPETTAYGLLADFLTAARK
jgi:homoserine dehydrogenase